MREDATWTGWHTFSLLVIVVAIVLVGLRVPVSERLTSWVATLLLMGLFIMIAGQGITGRWLGFLVGDHNRMSLSRLQMVSWTIIILSGFLTAALSNVRLGAASPLSIALPRELWLLMGISTTALVGSPLVLSPKRTQQPDLHLMALEENLLVDQGVDIGRRHRWGVLVRNDDPSQAKLSDLFTGEETGNQAHLDLARVQMFFFTVVLILTYATALASSLACASVVVEFPPLDQSMVALLAISHAGYLTNKAVPHSGAR